MRIVLTLLLLLAAPLAFAADPLSIPAITLGTGANGQQEYSVSLQILLIMTALSFIPAFVMLMTSFTRIIIVFSILRQALGLQQTPSNQILTGMALFLTLFIMAPVFDRVNNDALQPYLAEKLTAQDAVAKAEVPIKPIVASARLATILCFTVESSLIFAMYGQAFAAPPTSMRPGARFHKSTLSQRVVFQQLIIPFFAQIFN